MGGGNNRARTCDPMLVRHVLSQLSYAPIADKSAAKVIILNAHIVVNMILIRILIIGI